MDGPLPKWCPAVALSRQDGHHSAVALLLKAALIQVSDYRLLGASGIHIEHICTFFVTFFSATIDGRDLIFGHKLHIGTPYRGKLFWTHQIPTSSLLTLLILIHIVHTFCICPFLVSFFSATIDSRNLIFGHKLHIDTPYCGKRFLTRQILTSSLPKSVGIISEQYLTVYLVFSVHNFCKNEI